MCPVASIKPLDKFLLPTGCDGSPWQGHLPHYVRPYPFIYLDGDPEALKVKYLAQEHNTLSTLGLELRPLYPEKGACTNHEVTDSFFFNGFNTSNLPLVPHQKALRRSSVFE